MSKYTTGEIAKLCGVSVRTVQYYDSRGILVPSELSEGGRRIYSEEDLRKMEIICFLRGFGLPIDVIKDLFSEEHPEKVISIIMDEQEKLLRGEIEQKQQQADKIAAAKKEICRMSSFSVESIGDVAHIMENRKKLRRLRVLMLIAAIPMNLIEIGTIVLWITTGLWWPFAVGMVIVAALGAWISYFYYSNASYICPECHSVFKPKFKQMFFARHTPNTRKLTCPNCSHHGFCVETYTARKEEQK